MSDDYIDRCLRSKQHGLPGCRNDWVEFIESTCKIKGHNVALLMMCFTYFLFFFFYLGRLGEIKRSKVTVSMCTRRLRR